MRISFLAVLAVALLVGLGVVVAIKSLGLLSSPAPQPIATPPKPIYVPPTMVLVGQRPLFAGDMLLPGDLGARPATAAELAEYKKHPDDYLPPHARAAYYRYVKESHPADAPLLKSDLEEVKKPVALNDRLLPGSRAVNVEVTKNQAAGALIQRGDWVDIYLTTRVRSSDSAHAPSLRTGLLARNAHVIATRDTLLPHNFPVRSDAVPYTLGLNPYRAALLDYAKTLGTITLEPVSAEERGRLDTMVTDAGQDPTKAALITVGDPSTNEGMEEASRVKDFRDHGLAVGTDDLAKAMMLKPLEPPPALVFIPNTEIEVFMGPNKHSVASFPPPRGSIKPPPRPAPEYIFANPADPVKPLPTSSGATPPPMKSSPSKVPFPR